jgi:hypothetical protein
MWRLLVVAVVLATSVVVGGAPASAFVPETDPLPIRGIGDKCMTKFDIAAGPVELQTCSVGNSSQEWQSGSDSIGIHGFNGILCLDVDGLDNGANVIVKSCNVPSIATQHWSYDFATSTLINNVSGRCVDTIGGRSADHTRLQIRDCVGSPSQQWKPTLRRPSILGVGNVVSTRSQLIPFVQVVIRNGAGGYRFNTSNVPPGLSLVPSHPEDVYDGHFHFEGVPTQDGTFGVGLTVTDFLGQTASTTFHWTVNAPIIHVSVPNVIGDTASQAAARLNAAGLRSQASDLTTDDQSVDGTVARQNPAPGSIVQTGTVVSVDVWHFDAHHCGPSAC